MMPLAMTPTIGGSVEMMTAMMLPGAIPALVGRARRAGGWADASAFLALYLCVWALAGLVLWQLYRPVAPPVAGALIVLGGIYELTPLKRRCRRHCLEHDRSSLSFSANCLGSSIGLMVVLASIDLMSLPLMVALAAVALLQKLAPPRITLDLPLALTILGVGLAVAAG